MSDHDDHADHGHGEGEDEWRVTAPMQSYTGRQVGIGFVVLAVGLLVTFVLPFLA